MEFKFSLRALIIALFLAASALAGAGEVPKDSLYQADASWLSASGKELQLKELRGTPVLMTMVYTECKYTCPMVLTKLKQIEQAVAGKPEMKIVLVSFDHQKDTPAALAKFMKEKELDEKRWVMITGKNSGSVRKLAALLGISYKREKSGDYSHSNVITLLDSEGVKRSVLSGLAADHSALVKTAKEMN